MAYQRWELQKENIDIENQREHLNDARLTQLRMYESRERTENGIWENGTQMEIQRKLQKGLNNKCNGEHIRQFYGSILETGF